MIEPFILFRVADVTYAVRSSQVQQVEMIEEITPVPNAPDFVEGVVHVRGQVVPVISLRARFGLEKRDYNLRSRLVIIDLDGRVVGMAVDTAREFTSLEAEQVQPPPDLISGVRGEYLEGVISLEGGLVLVLDLRRVLTDPERAELQT